MKRQSDLPTLAAGIAWLEGHLDELADIPYRLHDHAVGDKDAFGAPRFSGAFWAALTGSAFAYKPVKVEETCYHAQLSQPPRADSPPPSQNPFAWPVYIDDARGLHFVWTRTPTSENPWLGRWDQRASTKNDCGECRGSDIREVWRDVYTRPLAAAMVALSAEPAVSAGTPAPIHFILALVETLDIEEAAKLVGVPIVSADHRLTVEAMFLRSIRKLYGRFRSGPVGRRDISDAQANAEAA